jgi:hypothetical protein
MDGYSRILVLIILLFVHSDRSLAEDFEWTSVGIRGAVNFKDAGLPPGEKVDFEQFDVVGTLGFPGRWEAPWDWQARYQFNTTAGALRGDGETGFIGTMTGGIALTKARWRVTVDIGVGGALLSKWKFPGQNVGGPFQFIGHGGLLFHLPLNLLAGYRFHHMSDATIYGNNRGVDLHMLEVRYRFTSP